MEQSNPLLVAVTSYPPDDSLIQRTLLKLEDLFQWLKENHKVDKRIQFVNLKEQYPTWSTIINRVIDNSLKTKGFISSKFISTLVSVSNYTRDVAFSFIDQETIFLKPLIKEIMDTSIGTHEIPKAIFISAPDLPLSIGKGMWGECIGVYPGAVAIEVSEYKESIFHECLHIFGVSEGYDENTKDTYPDCVNCWMQYEAIHGSGLCQKHLNELQKFLKNI
ncbi:MAG: hypothetical protein AB1757_22095 [Acidobacteriota bacterium]